MRFLNTLALRLLNGVDRGTAAIELAIIAPLLMMMVLGISDVAMSTLAKFKSGNATASGVDLSTQAANLQVTDMSDVFAGATNVLSPLPTTNLAFRVTSIASNGNGSAFVHWSCGMGALPALTAKSNFTTLANGDAIGNALNLYNFASGGYVYNGTNTTLMQVESRYGYTPPVQFLLKGVQMMTAAYYNYPRQAAYVGFPWDGVASDPPTAPNSATRIGTTTLANGAICSYAY